MSSPSTYPKTRHEMIRADYKRTGSGTCKGCDAPIEWWLTTNGKKMPFNPGGEYDDAVTHYATCPKAREFRANPKAAAKTGPGLGQVDRDVRALCEKWGARVVVLIDDSGMFSFWRSGIPGEDLRSDLIAAGNSVRNKITQGDRAQ